MSVWSDLNNEGVRLAAAGDLAAARDKLEAALAVAPPEDRAQCLLNLAQVVDLTGEREHAVDLLTEAYAIAERSEAMSLIVAARADILPWLGRWDEAWQDVEAALADTEPPQQVALRHSRVGLLMMAGRLAEAEQEATATVALAALHAPEYMANLYASLAMLAEEAGDDHRAATYRLLGDNPDQEPLGPRWLRFVELNTEGVVKLSSGDRAGAAAAFEAAYRETLGSDDAEALVCRAGAAGNLVGVDEAGVMRWSTEAITAARTALELVGDKHGTAATLVNALVSRASAHLAHTRLTEALEDLDEALTVDDAHASVRAVRARVLAIGGRYAEAAQEARTALDLAYANEPALAATVHMTLAEITSGTGDLPGAVEHLALARDLCAATGDVASEATAVLSSARLAYLASDGDTADALYLEATALLDGNDMAPGLLAACLVGRAAVAVLRGKPAEAVELVDRAHALLGTATPLALVAIHQVRGAAYEAAGDFAAAETAYADAAASCSAAGLWHVALGMAWWRADALVRRAAAVTGDERRAIAERALDLALPAALAAEAVRQRFPHGPLRERWVALASAPAIRSAFLAIRAVEDVALAAAYVDHLAGAVSFEAGSALVAREDLVSLPEPPAAEPQLPPRVRVDPAVPSTLDHWLDVTEERYGFPVRSAQAVLSW